MKNRTNCKIIASRPQRSSIISKTNSDGIPFAVLLVPPTPASVGGVRKQESCYNVNCELSDEAHCHASCCALGVPLHRPAFTAEARPTDPEPPTPTADARQSIFWSLFFFFWDLTDFPYCPRWLNLAPLPLFISATGRVIRTVHLRDTVSSIQPLNVPLRKVVNLTVLWK